VRPTVALNDALGLVKKSSQHICQRSIIFMLDNKTTLLLHYLVLLYMQHSYRTNLLSK
jgi:hypothetical protein